MISKVISFCRTDGLENTANYIWRTITTALGLRASETFFLRFDISEQRQDLNPDDREEIEVIRDSTILDIYGFERLDYIPHKEWIRNGSTCYVKKSQNRVISYCWAHSTGYSVDNEIGSFELSDSEAWIGPIFVEKRHRGRGISAPLIDFAVRDQVNAGKDTFFTATNSENFGSQKTFAKLGFVIVGLSHIRRIGRHRLSNVFLDVNIHDYLRKRLH